MATIFEILQARTEAGQACAAAVSDLKATYIGLRAHDIALGNANLPTPNEADRRSFGAAA